MNPISPKVCVIGDTHGHLQLGLCMAARWQQELQTSFDAVFLCGDVGTFAEESQLDNATRRHGKANPCELEFLNQWAADPQPNWLQKIFQPVEKGGRGLLCPVVIVHGNHEGFALLERIIPPQPPAKPVPCAALPGVDAAGHIRYLTSGWHCVTPGGVLVGGIGGIERGQRQADYHRLAYIDDDAVLRLLEGPKLDILVTHQGPADTQGDVGSSSLQMLLDEEIAKVWFHGHSIPNPDIVHGGPKGDTLIVPLGDVAFPGKGLEAEDPGKDAWAWVQFQPDLVVDRQRPEFWREFRRYKWEAQPNGQLVCPCLACL
jgi:hypothetical protein